MTKKLIKENGRYVERPEISYKQVKLYIKELVECKGLNNIINADLNEIHERTGASSSQMQNALSYFKYSPQTAKYRS